MSLCVCVCVCVCVHTRAYIHLSMYMAAYIYCYVYIVGDLWCAMPGLLNIVVDLTLYSKVLPTITVNIAQSRTLNLPAHVILTSSHVQDQHHIW